jgi:hypothetical protein
MGDERRRLSREGVNDAGVTVADDRDVVVHVNVAAAVGVEHPGAVTAHEVHRPLIEKWGVLSQ